MRTRPNIMDSGYVKPGDFALNFINANTVDISALKLDAVASAVASYNRSLMNGNGAIVSNINFAPTGLSQNAASLGEAINQIQLAEIATFRPVAAPLFYRPDLEALQETYNLLSGEGSVASQQLYFTQNAGVMSDLSMHIDFWRSKSAHAQNNGFATVSCSAENEAGSARIDVKTVWKIINGAYGSQVTMASRSNVAKHLRAWQMLIATVIVPWSDWTMRYHQIRWLVWHIAMARPSMKFRNV